MSLNSTFQVAANAIDQIAHSTNATAHNIANVNTQNYNAIDATGIYDQSWLYNHIDSYLSYDPLLTENGIYNTFGDAAALEISRTQDLLNDILNDVDIAREFTKMIADEHAFVANTKVITAADRMYGIVVNLKV